jgi:hypothetical protein
MLSEVMPGVPGLQQLNREAHPRDKQARSRRERHPGNRPDALHRIAPESFSIAGQPVLIVLGHSEVGLNGLHKKDFSYNKVFTWSFDEIEDFKKSTVMVAKFDSSYGDENYRVYAVK